MPLIEALTVAVVGAASVSGIAVIIIVVLGIRHEERRLSMTRRLASGLTAWMTRQIVGLYVRKTDHDEIPGDDRIRPMSRTHRP